MQHRLNKAGLVVNETSFEPPPDTLPSATGDALVQALTLQQRRHNILYTCACEIMRSTQTSVKPFNAVLFHRHALLRLIPETLSPESEVQCEVYVSFTSLSESEHVAPLPHAQIMAYTATQASQHMLATSASSLDDMDNRTPTRVQTQDAELEALLRLTSKEEEMEEEEVTKEVEKEDEQEAMEVEVEETPKDKELQEEYELDKDADLELDALNRLPAMKEMLATLDLMKQKHFVTINQIYQQTQDLPAWVQVIQYTLQTTSRNHTNARLFACKVLMNRATLFFPYASVLAPLVMQTFVALELPYASTRGIHYLLRDACALLGRWDRIRSGCLRPKDSDVGYWHTCSQFINLLIASSYGKGEVLRLNLVYIAGLLAHWKPSDTCKGVSVDLSVVYGMVSYAVVKNDDTYIQHRAAGLAILGLLVQHGFKCVPEDRPARECVLLVVENYTKKQKLRKSSAKVAGMMMGVEGLADTVEQASKDGLMPLTREWTNIGYVVEILSEFINPAFPAGERLLLGNSVEKVLGAMRKLQGKFLELVLGIACYVCEKGLKSVEEMYVVNFLGEDTCDRICFALCVTIYIPVL